MILDCIDLVSYDHNINEKLETSVHNRNKATQHFLLSMCKVTPRTLSLFDTSDFTRGVYLKHQINYDTDI